MRQSRGLPAYLMLLFQSLLLALPARPSNSVGVNHCWLCLMQRPFPPEDNTQNTSLLACVIRGQNTSELEVGYFCDSLISILLVMDDRSSSRPGLTWNFSLSSALKTDNCVGKYLGLWPNVRVKRSSFSFSMLLLLQFGGVKNTSQSKESNTELAESLFSASVIMIIYKNKKNSIKT